MKVLVALVILCAFCQGAPSQETEPQFVIGVALTGSKPSCPVFVNFVRKNSPAAAAGIKPGDRVIAVDGNTTTDVQDAARRLTSKTARPVTVQLIRDEKPYRLTVEREDIATVLQKDGWKVLGDGTLVRSDATDGEVKQLHEIEHALEDAEDRAVAFPGHYPVNKQLYYPGFEAFIWDKGNQVTVGGTEDGPASREGVRWGDRIIAVNGVDPHGKSIVELESLLSSPIAATMRLTIERASIRKTFSFELAQAATVLRENHWQVRNGKLVPLWAPEKYLNCFE